MSDKRLPSVAGHYVERCSGSLKAGELVPNILQKYEKILIKLINLLNSPVRN